MYSAAATDATDATEQTDSAPHSESKEEVANDKDTTAPSEATKDEEKTLVSCDAVDMDRLKHQKLTGNGSVDVRKLVVCLNYSQYMRLGELFELGAIGQEQREMMEKRYEELVLALCPELTDQLVIDLKVCMRNGGGVQITEEVGVSVDPPIIVDNALVS